MVKPPPFKYALTTAVVALVAATCFGFFLLEQQAKDLHHEVRDRNEQDCSGRVEARDAVRNIFFFLVTLAKDPNSEPVKAITAYIDKSLPPIVCTNPAVDPPTPVTSLP